MPFKLNPITGELDLVNTQNTYTFTSLNYTGSDCTGDDGDTDRVLSSASAVTQVVVDNQSLHPDIDYSLSGTAVTFINQLWNQSNITIWTLG